MFSGDESEGLKRLHRILLSYSFYNFDLVFFSSCTFLEPRVG
jgi:hypothetical protein